MAGAGRYRADWFLRFLGLESFPAYRQGRRLENYRDRPPLSDAAIQVLHALLVAAAKNLERLDTARFPASASPAKRVPMLVVLADLTLEELASG